MQTWHVEAQYTDKPRDLRIQLPGILPNEKQSLNDCSSVETNIGALLLMKIDLFHMLSDLNEGFYLLKAMWKE